MPHRDVLLDELKHWQTPLESAPPRRALSGHTSYGERGDTEAPVLYLGLGSVAFEVIVGVPAVHDGHDATLVQRLAVGRSDVVSHVYLAPAL